MRNPLIDSTSINLGKKQCVDSTSHLPMLAAEEPSSKHQRPTTTTLCYNDSSTADVVLRLVPESPPPPPHEAVKSDLCEEMLDNLITSAMQNHENVAFRKSFAEKFLSNFSSRDVTRRVLGRAFEKCLRLIQQSVEDYLSPDLRGDHSEMEAIQMTNLHSAMINGKHLLWLVEGMVELKVADEALKTWSDQSALISDLQRVFREDAWKNIAPTLPSIMMRCTSRLVNALATGNILADKQIRAKIVREWLPMLIMCKDIAPSLGPNHKAPHVELEQAFLKIISTLPMSDSQELLPQCLRFTARTFDEYRHLVDAFTTWFRRANADLPMKP